MLRAVLSLQLACRRRSRLTLFAGLRAQVTIPSASFSGDTVLRALPIKLFGAATIPARVRGYTCDATNGFSFKWYGEVIRGDPIPLGFSQQVRAGGPRNRRRGLQWLGAEHSPFFAVQNNAGVREYTFSPSEVRPLLCDLAL